MTCPPDCRPCAELDAHRDKACTRKVPYSAKKARIVAREMTSTRARFQAYRCVFADDGHWHVGHSLGWETVEHLAVLLRHRAYPIEHPKGTAA